MKKKIDNYRIALGKSSQFMRFVVMVDSFDRANDSFGNWMLGVPEKRNTSFKDLLDLFRNVLMVGASFALFGQYVRYEIKRAALVTTVEYVLGWASLITLLFLSLGLLYQGTVVMIRLPIAGRWPIKIFLAILWAVLAAGFFFMTILAISKLSGQI